MAALLDPRSSLSPRFSLGVCGSLAVLQAQVTRRLLFSPLSSHWLFLRLFSCLFGTASVSSSSASSRTASMASIISVADGR